MSAGDTPLQVDWVALRVVTAAQRATYTPVDGEPLLERAADGTLIEYVGDGVTVGGKPQKIDYANVINKPGTFAGLGLPLSSTDIPSLDWAKIGSGKPTTLAGYGITDAASAAAVATAIAGLAWKQTVRTATTANITLSGVQTVDGVALIAGDRVLVKDQTTGSANGIYVVAVGAWTRATDADTGTELVNSLIIPVAEGAVNADTHWQMLNDGVITLGTTALIFQQFNGATIAAGAGLVKTGNVLSVAFNAIKAKPLP